ncbi:MAG TPA: kelch repeat-containing protein, partial [Candidatus Limnocylindrales bacterium]|nr:kelch repeat-containing protein [Candidatus Limnocylindrales bacterium]
MPLRGNSTSLLPNGDVLVAGGFINNEAPMPIASVELYDPATGTWAPAGSMIEARGHHTATLLSDGHVLVAGGDNIANSMASAELYDSARGTWTATGGMAAALGWQTAVLLGNGKVLAVGENHAELYNPGSGTWTVTRRLIDDVGNFSSATLLPDGAVLLAGGGAREGCAVAS